MKAKYQTDIGAWQKYNTYVFPIFPLSPDLLDTGKGSHSQTEKEKESGTHKRPSSYGKTNEIGKSANLVQKLTPLGNGKMTGGLPGGNAIPFL